MTHDVRHRAPMAGGFTLIEVLIATFIIALGVLGLLALFSGAARQQQVSSQRSTAFINAGNAESSLFRVFGALRVPPGAPEFTQGVWYRLPMHADHHYLMAPNAGAFSQGAFFLSAPAETLPRAMYTIDDPGGTYTNPVFGIPVVSQFSGTPVPPYDNATADYNFPHRSIEPDSVRVEVEYRRAIDNGGVPEAVWGGGTLVFMRSPGVTYASDAASQSSGRWVIPVDGDATHDPNDLSGRPADERNYIIVDVQPDSESITPAYLHSIHIGDIGSAANANLSGHVTAIRVLDYRWRNNQMISFSDRTVRRSDASAPDGVRADQTYSVLFRRTATGSQAAIMSYQLTAPSSSARYLPPETIANLNNNTAPIRRAVVTLRWDDDEDQYYIRIPANQPELLWAIAPGQVLIVEGDPSAANDPGSDGPVTIIRQVREAQSDGGQWRGYLDRGPRAGDLAILHPAAGQRTIRVFGAADTVTSRADSSVWKLSPLRTTVISVPFSN